MTKFCFVCSWSCFSLAFLCVFLHGCNKILEPLIEIGKKGMLKVKAYVSDPIHSCQNETFECESYINRRKCRIGFQEII